MDVKNNRQLRQCITLMMEAASTYAASGNVCQTTSRDSCPWRSISEGSHHHKQQVPEEGARHVWQQRMIRTSSVKPPASTHHW
jgi:hypothetical protein